MSKVEEARGELGAEMERVAPILEGLYDYGRLNLQPATLAVVTAAIEQYERRVAVVRAAIQALEALLADGYPTLEIPPVDRAVMADLRANHATLTAALAQFVLNEAVTLRIRAEDPMPQANKEERR